MSMTMSLTRTSTCTRLMSWQKIDNTYTNTSNTNSNTNIMKHELLFQVSVISSVDTGHEDMIVSRISNIHLCIVTSVSDYVYV